MEGRINARLEQGLRLGIEMSRARWIMSLMVAIAFSPGPGPVAQDVSHCPDYHFEDPDAPGQHHLSPWDLSTQGRDGVGSKKCYGRDPTTFEPFLVHRGILSTRTAANPVQRQNLPAARLASSILGAPGGAGLEAQELNQSSLDDIVAPYGCAMAHCDQGLRDLSIVYGPYATSVTALWHDASVHGSFKGLGCSSNTTIAVCSLARGTDSSAPTLVAYDAGGSTLWTSSLLNATAFTSAPIVGNTGQVIAADDSRLVRFDNQGGVLWETEITSGLPISPNVTDDRIIFLATAFGPLFAYDADNGSLLAELALEETLLIDGHSIPGIFHSINTSAIRGNRAYITTHFYRYGTKEELPYGRLYAVDINRTGPASAEMTVAWFFEVRGASRASPLLYDAGQHPIVYFDGEGLVPLGEYDPHFFAVQDLGSQSTLLWQYAMSGSAVASAAQDPRGGIWVYSQRIPYLLRLSQFTGKVIQWINVDALIQEEGTHSPSSAITITGSDPNKPLMLLSATARDVPSSHVIAIYPPSGGLVWKFLIDQSADLAAVPYGQFPIVVDADGDPVVVFSTRANGIWALTMP